MFKMDGSRRSSANILVVGAGGIGCELLKNLVLDDFQKITIVDLDTIDISNLNRQFLFHRAHVGRSKAEVARESVLAFRPDAHVTAYHKSIFSSAFDADFYSKFDIVFNALDNQAARRHVNRMCVATKRPLIESGSAGYLGQVEPILPSGWSSSNQSHSNLQCPEEAFHTGCYECQPRGASQRSYPACTIRNTPSEPIHCVVWAKYLFNQLFGEPDVDDEDVSPDFSDPDLHHGINSSSAGSGDRSDHQSNGTAHNDQTGDTNGDHNSVLKDKESLRLWFQKQCLGSHLSDGDGSGLSVQSAARSLAWRLFHHDILTLVEMRDLWVDRPDRKEPTPLDVSTLNTAVKHHTGLSESSTTELRDQRQLPAAGWLRLFMDSVAALQNRCSRSDEALVWDKDDEDAMDFVTGASILRAQLFHLPGADKLTRFTIKSLAGNIIPAIATTNAIVAGLMVLQARHVLAGSTKNIKTVYLHRQPTGRRGNRRLVVPCEPPHPNPDCFVCSAEATRSQLGLVCCPTSLSLRVLRDRILIRHLGMLAPDVELEDRGVILISSEEGETDEATLDKTLGDLGVAHGSKLQCDDFRQDFTIHLTVSSVSSELAHAISSSSDTDSGNPFDVGDPAEGWRLTGDVQALLTGVQANPESSLDGVRPEIRRPDDHLIGVAEKRSRTTGPIPSTDTEDAAASPSTLKRARLGSEAEDAAVLVQDDEDDELVILD
ncbi:unnamed protein product [Calicophoron daubneyi]|uniref:SUMO-activating enzyme subunit n=1 Tax=Calicophoron daubneyi TaxID=300641 RepID=A0AAV2TC79_CALDB